MGTRTPVSLRSHIDALRSLARATVWSGEQSSDAFRLLTKVAARTLGVGRASIWLYDQERSSIECMTLYEVSTDNYDQGVVLRREDFPDYFSAMDKDAPIVATDAYTDPRTREFGTSYLPATGVRSLLDAPIMRAGRCVGVVCHEHLGEPKEWTEEEEVFACSIADFATIAIEADERARIEKALLRRELELSSALDAARMGTYTLNAETGVFECSPQIALLLGRPTESIGDFDVFQSLLHVNERDVVKREIDRIVRGETEEFTLELRCQRLDGSFHWIEQRGYPMHDESGKPCGVAGILMSTEDRHKMEDQLHHHQRMEGLGRLAGGIAHDLNNLLTVMSMSGSMIARRSNVSVADQDDVGILLQSIDRAAALTNQLLTFARKQPSSAEIIDVNACVMNMADLFKRLLGEEYELVLETDSAQPLVLADPRQLEQVLINLVINARDATPEGGEIRLRVRAIEREDTLGTVEILVQDFGEGIPEELHDKIFEPFFTTKKIGKGTGLGLASCYGIVKKFGGNINLASTVGKGTTMTVRLPQVQDERKNPSQTTDGDTRLQSERGVCSVLVVEDQDEIRSLCTRSFEDAGYQVFSARSPKEALQLAAQDEVTFQLVVSDVVMPDMRGPEMVERLRAILPNIRVLYISGYADIDLKGEPFLAKPFDPDTLIERAEELLDMAQAKTA